MALSATKVTDRESMRETLEETLTGLTGRRYFKVMGVAELQDIPSQPVTGLPKLRESWSDDLADLIVTGRQSDWWSFPKDGVDGVALVAVRYGERPEDQFTQRPPLPEKVEDQWTEYSIGLESQTIVGGYVNGPNNTAVKSPLAINNGQGMTISIGVPEVRVVTHYPLDSGNFDIARFIALSSPPKVNAAPISTPPLWDTGVKLKFGVGQLLYVSHQVERVREFLQVTHLLRAAVDHWVRWQPEGPDGKLITDENQMRVVQPYQVASFVGLWRVT